MKDIDYCDIVCAYFIATQQRINPSIIVDLFNLGGENGISKSFARAISSRKQMATYQRRLTIEELLSFLKGVSNRHNISSDLLQESLFKCSSFDDILSCYSDLINY